MSIEDQRDFLHILKDQLTPGYVTIFNDIFSKNLYEKALFMENLGYVKLYKSCEPIIGGVQNYVKIIGITEKGGLL